MRNELLCVELVRKQFITLFFRIRLRTGTFVWKGGKKAKKSNGNVLYKVHVHVYRTSRSVSNVTREKTNFRLLLSGMLFFFLSLVDKLHEPPQKYRLLL